MLLKWPDKCSEFSVRQGKVRPILAPFFTYLPWYICYKFQEFRVLYTLVPTDFTVLFPIHTEPGGLCSGPVSQATRSLWKALPTPTTHPPVHKMPIWSIWVWYSDHTLTFLQSSHLSLWTPLLKINRSVGILPLNWTSNSLHWKAFFFFFSKCELLSTSVLLFLLNYKCLEGRK